MAKSGLQQRAEQWAAEHSEEVKELAHMLDRVSKENLQNTLASFVLAGAKDCEHARQLLMEAFPEVTLLARCSVCDAYLDEYGQCPERH